MVVYVAGPYSGATREEIQQNINIAEAAGKGILKAGHTPLIPHRMAQQALSAAARQVRRSPDAGGMARQHRVRHRAPIRKQQG